MRMNRNSKSNRFHVLEPLLCEQSFISVSYPFALGHDATGIVLINVLECEIFRKNFHNLIVDKFSLVSVNSAFDPFDVGIGCHCSICWQEIFWSIALYVVHCKFQRAHVACISHIGKNGIDWFLRAWLNSQIKIAGKRIGLAQEFVYRTVCFET